MSIVSTLQNALKKYMIYKIENGSYKFFVQKLEAEPDIDLAADLYSTDYFRHNLKPLPIETQILKKIIVFAPHQDDEVIGCGGILTQLSSQGCEVHLVFLTDGENRSGKMSKVRQDEARIVTKILGGSMHDIGISNVELKVDSRHINKISTLLDEINPEAIFVTWPLDSPAIHRLCNVVISIAMKQSSLNLNKQQTFSYQVHTALLPNVYYEYTKEFEQKQALIAVYESQMKDQNYQHLSAGLDAWNSRFLPWSEQKRYVELFTQMPAVAYCEMIENFYPKNLAQTFKGNQNCIDSYHALLDLTRGNIK